MTRTLRILAALGLAASAGAASAEADLWPRYAALSDRYREGRRDEALAALAQWHDADVQAVLQQAVAGGCPQCPLAMMLHTDLALKLHPGGIPVPYDLHVNSALKLSQALPRTADWTRFGASWWLAVGLRHANPTSALGWFDAGLERYPEDPYLLLALGALEESFVAFGTVRSERAHLSRDAESHLRRALTGDGNLHDGRVRLAHLLMSRGDSDAALEELDVVLARAPDKDLLYLARLFQGKIRERQGRTREAALAYAAALAVDERWQTARLALSQARWRLGDAPGALAVLQPAVELAPGRAESMDPWWLYPWVQRWQADALFDALRQEASR